MTYLFKVIIKKDGTISFRNLSTGTEYRDAPENFSREGFKQVYNAIEDDLQTSHPGVWFTVEFVSQDLSSPSGSEDAWFYLARSR